MIFWNLDTIRHHMARLGWGDRPRHLSQRAGIGYPAAWQIFQGHPVTRIDVRTLEALATAFGVKPWSLLRHED